MKSHASPRFCTRLLVPLALLIAGAASATDGIQERFDAALRAIDSDHLLTARQTLQDLLADNPSLNRARLELARVHYLSEDFPKARAEAQRVLDDPTTPPAVRATVLAFLAQIDADEKRASQRHQWRPSIYAGLMYDSNVNIGPNRDVIDIGGTLFTVSPGSRETDDFAWVVNPAISHIYNPGTHFQAGEHTGTFIWQTDASAYYRGYFDEDDFNLGVLTLRTGPAWIVPRHWRASIGLQADQIWLGSGRLALFTALNPGAVWQVGTDWELGLDATIGYRDYHRSADSGRDGWDRKVNASAARYFNNRRWALLGGIGYHDFDADEDRFGYRGPELYVGAIAQAWENGMVYARAGYMRFDFDGREPLFNKGRDDDEWRYTVGFQHDFRNGLLAGWALQGSWVYTDNQSGVDIYEYDRHVVNLGLARSF
ncbi:MAG: surface lipoprotein assembly modifier [Gammaproteobacteria bacterium]